MDDQWGFNKWNGENISAQAVVIANFKKSRKD